jgi:hypothetical protein
VRAATEASKRSVEVVYTSKRSDRGVVIRGVVEYEVTQLIASNTVYFKRFDKSRCDSLTRIRACKLW